MQELKTGPRERGWGLRRNVGDEWYFQLYGWLLCGKGHSGDMRPTVEHQRRDPYVARGRTF